VKIAAKKLSLFHFSSFDFPARFHFLACRYPHPEAEKNQIKSRAGMENGGWREGRDGGGGWRVVEAGNHKKIETGSFFIHSSRKNVYLCIIF
jgi:hypothetical protein